MEILVHTLKSRTECIQTSSQAGRDDRGGRAETAEVTSSLSRKSESESFRGLGWVVLGMSSQYGNYGSALLLGGKRQRHHVWFWLWTYYAAISTDPQLDASSGMGTQDLGLQPVPEPFFDNLTT